MSRAIYCFECGRPLVREEKPSVTSHDQNAVMWVCPSMRMDHHFELLGFVPRIYPKYDPMTGRKNEHART